METLAEEHPMPDTLYFIRILTEALRRPDLDAAMREAVAVILERQHAPEYRAAFRQCLQFVDSMLSADDDLERETLTEVALRMALGRIIADPSESECLPNERPEDKGPHASYARAMTAMREFGVRSAPLMVQVRRNGDFVASFPVPLAEVAVVRGLQPDSYAITLDTGRLLWSGELGPADLIWRHAFPGRPLGVAAESSAPSTTPTRRIILAVGTLIIVVYPGMETGSIQLVTGEPIA
jgi:hypothetical protein